jgi:2-keto-3-deoxy-L-rhamnonate aldolase RhmA
MVEVRNITKEKLARGELALGVGLRNARTVDIGKAMATAGFDWLFIDMEHNAMGIDIATQIAVAGQDAGITPLVRVPGFEHHLAARALDGGAQGIVFPHVDDAETAVKLVSYCRYPPHGKRSMTGSLSQIDFKKYPLDETAKGINEGTFVVMMLETPEAIANADKIAAVPGVDALLIGTNDLCFEMGIPGQFTHEKVVAAYQTMVDACKAHGKFPGMGGVYAVDQMKTYTDMGVRLILSGNDFSFMMNGAMAQSSAIRELV